MNKVVVFSIGVLVTMLGVMFLIPAAIDLSNTNPDWKVFVFSSVSSIFLGVMLMVFSAGRPFYLGRREGYFLTVGSWLAMSLVAALPFWLSSQEISFADAVFESVSGLTTTGSTIFTGLDTLPHGLLVWRAMLQWIGGIGIIVMAVTLLPFLRVGGMQLYRLEASDNYDKITPRIADVCLRIIGIYIALSFICAGAYWFFGMTVFESFIHAMTTVSTGGFSTSDQSLGHFGSPAIEWTAIIFMLAGSLPFTVYIRYLHSFEINAFSQDSQTQPFLIFTTAFIFLVAAFLIQHQFAPTLETLRLAAFSVVSIITTTGYANGNYLNWGIGIAILFFFLTLIGGCAGSTAGGLKTFRLLALYKGTRNQSLQMQYPHVVFKNNLGQQNLSADGLNSVYIFFFVMIAVLVLLALSLSLTGLDFITSLSAAATSIANVGPGLGGLIGPTGTFAPLSDAAKWILDFGMLAGRLEYFTVLVLFLPDFWRD